MKTKILLLLVVMLLGCKSQQLTSNYQETTENISKTNNELLINSDTDLKIIEYDTVYIHKKDTIIQPIKKIIYLTKKEDIKETTTEDNTLLIKEKEDVKETSKPSFQNYIIAFCCGFGLMVILLIIWKIIVWYIKRKL